MDMKQERRVEKIECPKCGATGLCKEWNCKEGAIMVCPECSGTGCKEIYFTPFSARKKVEADDVKRIFQFENLRTLYPDLHIFGTGSVVDFSKSGCLLEEWENGENPKPLPKA